MNTWEILIKELKHYGIDVSEDNSCVFSLEENKTPLGVIPAVKKIKNEINQYKKYLNILWSDYLLKEIKDNSQSENDTDDILKNIFEKNLHDLIKFLDMFDEKEVLYYKKCVLEVLDRDINSFSKEQINNILRYKIAIDWVHRVISRLLYVHSLMISFSLGKNYSSKYDLKTARGVAGPWSNLDLPMLERAYPYEDVGLDGIKKDKQDQRRYRKGFENYNKPGVGEGHYWRELRNEPFSWADRASESPYPARKTLMNWG